MSFDNTLNLAERPAEATDDEKHRATRYVASNSHDADDCRELLQMLGLMDPGFRWADDVSKHHRRHKIQEDQ